MAYLSWQTDNAQVVDKTVCAHTVWASGSEHKLKHQTGSTISIKRCAARQFNENWWTIGRWWCIACANERPIARKTDWRHTHIDSLFLILSLVRLLNLANFFKSSMLRACSFCCHARRFDYRFNWLLLILYWISCAEQWLSEKLKANNKAVTTFSVEIRFDYFHFSHHRKRSMCRLLGLTFWLRFEIESREHDDGLSLCLCTVHGT